ncbi:hypothetical protein GE300_13440 [Rhodobacteraceae bacterium 2CG4]|uniref:Uncharacterized protein n=1 Tax=Halovulum marinum TaxID=2662447 RepID=A0A6L5Z212_9RHOB|nr:DUF6010 family protein [Halovulum marinum]MSU90606.1 hypothetical protein [Halovulum marinum]
MSGDHIQDRQTYEIVGSSGLGAVLFLVFAPVHLMVAQDVSVAIAAVTLALIGGAYVGFGAASDSRTAFWLELAVAVLYGLTAVLGLLWHPMALPAGLAAHALWDLAHHNGLFGARVPRWYIPFCVVFDLLAAAFLFVLYLT